MLWGMNPPEQLIVIPDGPAGVDWTLDCMRAYIRLYQKFGPIRRKAAQLAAMAPQRDFVGQVNEIFTWLQNNIKYVGDTLGVETLQTPAETLAIGGGDCDDQATLLGAMLQSIDFPTKSVACGFEPDLYEHVFLQVYVRQRQRWYNLDPTEPFPMDWKPPGIVCTKTRNNS